MENWLHLANYSKLKKSYFCKKSPKMKEWEQQGSEGIINSTFYPPWVFTNNCCLRTIIGSCLKISNNS